MGGKKQITLSSAPFYASLVVITALAGFIGAFWAFNEYQAYQESIENIKDNYRYQYEGRLEEELAKVEEMIDYRRLQNDLRVEQDIRERVQAAYTIASHNYQLYKDAMSEDELRGRIRELLRPVRWSNGRGYYFVGRVSARKLELFADEPYFEGMDAEEFRRITGRDLIGDSIAIVREKEAGLYRYDLFKPHFPGRSYPKIAFVKYFAPLDWFIGAGLYYEDLEDTVQQEILARIANIEFGGAGEVFCLRTDGTILSHREARLIGRSALDLLDSEGRSFGKALLATGRSTLQGDFVHYSVLRDDQDSSQQKLSFVKKYPKWGWLLCTTISMDAMEQAIAAETETYQRISFKNVSSFIILFIIAVVFLLVSAYFYSLKIREGIKQFTNFFHKAAVSSVKINADDLAFREFGNLGELANRMVEDRVKNELLLHRDELRLDTLLRLGMMEKYSLPDKYRFILQRILQITRSEEGYLGLVNAGQQHITICAYLGAEVTDIACREAELSGPRSIIEAGLPGRAVIQKTARIVNEVKKPYQMEESFPYRQPVHNHLDVPIFNDGRIVVVAGVCNNAERYDNSDIRQMTMLLEGLWMHVLKKVAEEEMVRLERQIIAVSEEERSKIGRDLHDDLGSHLSGVELLSKVLQQKLQQEPSEHTKELGVIRNLIREAIEKTRRLSQGLYPVHVVEYGLESAVEELANEVKQMAKVDFVLQWEGDATELGKNTATHLHYIIREAVFNAVRHGKPQKITIDGRLRRDGFRVKIIDDGRGFETNSAARGMGFHTMKYRAKAIGATLSIHSTGSGGTVINVSGAGME